MKIFFETSHSGQIKGWSDRAENSLGWTEQESKQLYLKDLVMDKNNYLKEINSFKKTGFIHLVSKTGVEIIFSGVVQENQWFLSPESETRSTLTNRKNVNAAHDGLVGVDKKLTITSANESAKKICQTTNELTGQNVRQVFEKAIFEEIEAVVFGSKEKLNIKTSKGDLDILINISPVQDVGGKTIGAALAIKDVSRENRALEKADYLETHSLKTGLINRGEFLKQIDQTIKDSLNPVVLILNINHFKLINDGYGYKKGDEVIVEVSKEIKKAAKKDMIVAHFGADEFAIFATNKKIDQMEDFLNNLIKQIKRALKKIVSLDVSLSAGISTERKTSSEQIVIAAGRALFEAKETGNQYIYHKKDRDLSLDFAGKIEKAIRDESILLYKQPIQNIKTGEVVRYELLLRIDDEGTIKTPEPFLEAADLTGLTERLDLLVIKKGIEFAATGVVVEINLSGKSLNNKSLVREISKFLSESHCDPSNVIFEITETSAVLFFDQASELITDLTKLGCRFMLDDFGTGFGSFSYLKNLPIYGIKIDGEFVKNMENSEVDQRIVAAIVMIAEALEKETVAEWVSSPETLHLLRDLGVSYAQGYLIGKPVPIDYN